MSKEAMKLALEALDRHQSIVGLTNNKQDVEAIIALRKTLTAQPAQQQEPVAWRELCRRLYIELYWCDRQMMETLDEDGEPRWTQGKEVRDVLADAKAALETSPPAQRKPWVGLTDEEVHALWMTGEANISEEHHSVVAYEIEAKLREKNT